MTSKNQYILEVNRLKFVNTKSGEIINNIWQMLTAGGWKHASVINFENNNLKGVLSRDRWQPVIPDILPMYEGMQWNEQKGKIEETRFVPKLKEVNFFGVITAANKLFKSFENKRIGVQLSGGLDSSIIIGLLNLLEIPFSLVGMNSSRYEFRTERYIQEKLITLAQDAVLINFEEHLPHSNLYKVPPHQHPELLSINFSSENAMSEACKKLGIEILLTGDGGDNLFAEALENNPNNCPWIPQIFFDTFLADLIYAPQGVQLIPFYADKGIMDCIFNLRKGMKEDNSKCWARKYFESILPKELANYNYCADFWGLYVSGLIKAKPTIKKLFEQVYQLTRFEAYSPKEVDIILEQDLLDARKQMYQKIEARIAFAVWIHSLTKVGVI